MSVSELPAVLARLDQNTYERLYKRTLETRRSMGSEAAVLLRDLLAALPSPAADPGIDAIASRYGFNRENQEE